MASASGGQRSIQLSYGRIGCQLSPSLQIADANVCSSDGADTFLPWKRRSRAMRQSGDPRCVRQPRSFRVLLPFGGTSHTTWSSISVEPGFLRVQCKTAWGRGMSDLQRPSDRSWPRPTVLCRPCRCVRDLLRRLRGHLSPPDRRSRRTEGRLRLEPTRNNQKLGIRFAADYEIDRWSIESLRGLLSHERSGADQLAFA